MKATRARPNSNCARNSSFGKYPSMRNLSLPFESRMSTDGVHKASKRWKLTGCSLMCDSSGTKLSSINAAVSSSSYDSASSRAHPPQAGAALKSMSRGFFCVLASVSAASASFNQCTFISVLLIFSCLSKDRVDFRLKSYRFATKRHKKHIGLTVRDCGVKVV